MSLIIVCAAADDRAYFRSRVYTRELPVKLPVKPAPAEDIDFAHTILLKTPENGLNAAPATHLFARGDEFRIEVTPTADGFLAVVQGGGSEASARRPVLYPEGNGDGRVKARQPLQIPASGSSFFRVKDSPTQLVIILSRERLELPAGAGDLEHFSRMLKERARDVKIKELSLKQR